MTKQKVFHNIEEDELELDQYISEICRYCGEELIRVEDTWTDLDSGNYCCEDCKIYYKLNAVECIDIYNNK